MFSVDHQISAFYRYLNQWQTIQAVCANKGWKWWAQIMEHRSRYPHRQKAMKVYLSSPYFCCIFLLFQHCQQSGWCPRITNSFVQSWTHSYTQGNHMEQSRTVSDQMVLYLPNGSVKIAAVLARCSGPLFGRFTLLQLNTLTFKYDISVIRCPCSNLQQIKEVFKPIKC